MSWLDPITRGRLARFRAHRPAWWSFLILCTLALLALLCPLLCGNRPLLLKVDGTWRFPVFVRHLAGAELGVGGPAEPNFRLLALRLEKEGRGWALFPPVPFAPDEVCEVMPAVTRDPQGRWCDPRGVIAEGRIFTLQTDGTRARTWSIVDGRPHGDARILAEGVSVARAKFINGAVAQVIPAGPPADWAPTGELRTLLPSPCPPGLDGHWLGTDESGHDVLARLFGGFRILLLAALIFVPVAYGFGLLLGAAMGYFGGWFDLVCQRLMEIWSNIPFLYAIILLSSLLEPTLALLVLILVAFSWIGIAQQLRATAYQVSARDYVLASRTLGAGHLRILWKHILPNCTMVILTTLPFTLHGLIFSMSALDYLGFGLPPTQPSWGDLLHQAKENWQAWWLLFPSVGCIVGSMILINYVGEGLQDAFDLKRSR
jgi:microcin C transport system permease protein